jgi:hypothetical protein
MDHGPVDMQVGRLDDNGRCCGKKPLHYKGGWQSNGKSMKFCDRCAREYDPITGEQRENWAWVKRDDGWERVTHAHAKGAK